VRESEIKSIKTVVYDKKLGCHQATSRHSVKFIQCTARFLTCYTFY